ncbi:MAG: acyl-CoA thioesterase [Dokdonella sp.]|nr:acyl-CoA thioesterase [Dokdonella sp.]
MSRSDRSDAPTGSAAAAPAAASAPLLGRYPVALRWRDLDAFNHVNNGNFLTFLEEARLRWLSAIEGPWFDEHSMPVVAAIQANYRRQLGWPAEIEVELYAERVGRSSLTVGHRIVAREDASLLYVDGHVVVVWIDPASGRSTPLPPAILAACERAGGA